MEVPVDWGGEKNSGGRGRGVSLAISQVPISIGLVGAATIIVNITGFLLFMFWCMLKQEGGKYFL
jgi:hypothetical protein